MATVNSNDITKAVCELGIKNGDIVLVHSSFKSMGTVEGGAEAVVKGFLDAIGKEGTLVFPTFTQKDFENAYHTWHIDKESDTGYLTNYFRKREGSLRSDQATHSVAACGKYARYLTKTHGHTHKRFGNMGETPFSADSPWEKMYDMNAKIVMLGVSEMKTTFRHYAEYVFIEECLKSIECSAKYDDMKIRLWNFGKKGVWPHIFNTWIVEELKKQNKVRTSVCGDATLLGYDSKDFVDFTLAKLREGTRDCLWDTEAFDVDGYIKWLDDLNKIREELKA